MEAKDIEKKLMELMHLDIDAVSAYDQALKNIDVPEVYERLSSFRADHEQHINNLSAALRRLGQTPPERKPDMKGFFIKNFTAIRSATGTEGALKAMQSNEKLTTSTYDEALQWDVPEDIKSLIRTHYTDEQRHLSTIMRFIDEKVWDVTPAI